ncbi:MAG: L-lactate permease [Anaerolineae bacterium]|nr:L-lactate permease [Anaerolineae bacterium]
MQLTFLNWLLAFSPLAVMLVLMLGFKWGGSKAGLAGFLAALLVSVLAFGAGPRLLGIAAGKSLLLSLDVLYVIWMALLVFQVTDEAGAVDIIAAKLSGLTGDRTMQGLILGWVFVSLLQGMGGFGVPVAVVAPLLVGLGFGSIQAVIMASIGHGWAVSFGSLATSFLALLAATNLPGEVIAPDAALMLGIASFFCGAIVAVIGGGWRGMLRTLPVIGILGAVMAVTQYLLVTNGLWTLGATGASLAGLVVTFALTRLTRFRQDETESTETPDSHSLWISLSAYLVLIVLAFTINLIPALKSLFNTIRLTVPFAEVSTTAGWITPAETGRQISLFGHPGAILLYASLIAFVIYQRSGYYEPGAARRILSRVAKNGGKSSLGILAMVGMAVIMTHAGMTNLLAHGISENVGATLYPLAAPFIGTLGAFMTGSNTSSNVVFGMLQRETAEYLGLSVSLILGAQSAGGALGSVLAPAKVIVGCSTVGLAGEEGKVIGKMLLYGLIPVAIVALVGWLMAIV